MGERLPLDFNKPARPSFEVMIDDLQRARRMWDSSCLNSGRNKIGLQGYSRSLLKIVARIAEEESSSAE